MSQGSARSSCIRAVGERGLLKFEECGVRELFITSCQIMIFGRQCWVLLEWKRWTRRSWYCKVLWRNLAELWIRCSPGNAVRWRRRWKTPPGRVLTAAAREMAPKINIRLKKAGRLKAEHVLRKKRMHHKRQAHWARTTHQKKGEGYPAGSTLTVPHQTPTSYRTEEKN